MSLEKINFAIEFYKAQYPKNTHQHAISRAIEEELRAMDARIRKVEDVYNRVKQEVIAAPACVDASPELKREIVQILDEDPESIPEGFISQKEFSENYLECERYTVGEILREFTEETFRLFAVKVKGRLYLKPKETLAFLSRLTDGHKYIAKRAYQAFIAIFPEDRVWSINLKSAVDRK